MQMICLSLVFEDVKTQVFTRCHVKQETAASAGTHRHTPAYLTSLILKYTHDVFQLSGLLIIGNLLNKWIQLQWIRKFKMLTGYRTHCVPVCRISVKCVGCVSFIKHQLKPELKESCDILCQNSTNSSSVVLKKRHLDVPRLLQMSVW